MGRNRGVGAGVNAQVVKDEFPPIKPKNWERCQWSEGERLDIARMPDHRNRKDAAESTNKNHTVAEREAKVVNLGDVGVQ